MKFGEGSKVVQLSKWSPMPVVLPQLAYMCAQCESELVCVLFGALPSLLVPPLSLKDLEEVRTKLHQKTSWYRETVQCIEESKRLLKVSRFMDGV